MSILCNWFGHDRRFNEPEAGDSIKRPVKDGLVVTLLCARCGGRSDYGYALPEWESPEPPPPDPPPAKVPPEKMTADFLKVECEVGGFNFTGHLPTLTVREQLERLGWHRDRGYNTLVVAAANSAGRDNTSHWPTYSFFDEPETLVPHLHRVRRVGFSICLFLMTDSHAALKAMSREQRWEKFKAALDIWEPYLSSVCPAIESDEWDSRADLQWMISKLAGRYPGLPRGVHFLPTMTEVEHGGWGWEWFSRMKDVDILFHQQVAWKVYPDGTRERRGPANVAHNVSIIAERCEDMGILFNGFENTPDKEATEGFALELAQASNQVLDAMGLPVVFGNGAHRRWTR